MSPHTEGGGGAGVGGGGGGGERVCLFIVLLANSVVAQEAGGGLLALPGWAGVVQWCRPSAAAESLCWLSAVVRRQCGRSHVAPLLLWCSGGLHTDRRSQTSFVLRVVNAITTGTSATSAMRSRCATTRPRPSTDSVYRRMAPTARTTPAMASSMSAPSRPGDLRFQCRAGELVSIFDAVTVTSVADHTTAGIKVK